MTYESFVTSIKEMLQENEDRADDMSIGIASRLTRKFNQFVKHLEKNGKQKNKSKN